MESLEVETGNVSVMKVEKGKVSVMKVEKGKVSVMNVESHVMRKEKKPWEKIVSDLQQRGEE